MSASSLKKYWLAAGLCGLLFVFLLLARSGMIVFPEKEPAGSGLPDQPPLAGRETWMKVLHQGKKIGYSHTRFTPADTGYRLRETLRMKVTALEQVHRVRLDLTARLHPDLSLDTFESRLDSGGMTFTAAGTVKNEEIEITTTTAGQTRSTRIAVPTPVYPAAGIMERLRGRPLSPGQTMTMTVFDPASLAPVPVRLTVGKRQTIRIRDKDRTAFRLRLSVKGLSQEAWIDKNGNILKQSGLMGMTLVKTDKQGALTGPSGASGDIAALVALPVDTALPDPAGLQRLTVAITGIDTRRLELSGGRQRLENGRLTITRESLDEEAAAESPGTCPGDLAPDMLIQSDHPDIRNLAADITAGIDSDRKKADRLVNWVYRNIDKQPVVSLPSALATLASRQGDCNEHAALLAALTRAAGIPARVETGLVYLEGRFYYHAWNRLYLDRWVTADASRGQLPADVTHIRLIEGDLSRMLDLLPVIGRMQLEIIDFSSRPDK
ncbi:MAG: transglutaminase domain-containing protein [Desulfosudaceae bacterium]